MKPIKAEQMMMWLGRSWGAAETPIVVALVFEVFRLRAKIARLTLGPPAPASIMFWGTVQLCGHVTIRGRFQAPEDIFSVDELRPDGTWKLHTVGKAALYQATGESEETVRKAVATQGGTYSPCESFTPSLVLATYCASCGRDSAAHERALEIRAAEKTVQVLRETRARTVEKLESALGLSGTRLSVYVSEWGAGSIDVLCAGVGEDDHNARPLTNEEWEKAREAGVPMGPLVLVTVAILRAAALAAVNARGGEEDWEDGPEKYLDLTIEDAKHAVTAGVLVGDAWDSWASNLGLSPETHDDVQPLYDAAYAEALRVQAKEGEATRLPGDAR